MCFFYVMYLISGRVLAPGMCALAASTCYTRIPPPRMRGKHGPWNTSLGSTLRMRGKQRFPIGLKGRPGITPACAGKRLAAQGHRPQARITPAHAGKTR